MREISRRRSSVVDAGGKAAGLRRLLAHGLDVPQAWIVPPDVEDVRSAIEGVFVEGRRYAIRSSAFVEDGIVESHAGQFATVLGVDEVAVAVQAVRDVRSNAPDSPHPVIVQKMVDAMAAGVVFSRHPITGLSDVIIEAVPGLASEMLAGRQEPQRWVVRWGEFVEKPGEPVASESLIRTIAEVAWRVDASDGPVDLEWAWDGDKLWWLQHRPITTADVAVYSNRIAKEVLPGLIHPLVWSVNVPVVNGAWIDLFSSVVGETGMEPEDLSARIGARAYFDMRAVGDIFEKLGMPRDLLEVLMGLEGGDRRPSFRPGPKVLRHIPRMLSQSLHLALYGRSLRSELAEVERHTVTGVAASDPEGFSDAGLAAAIEELAALARRVARANILTPLLMNLYGGRFRAGLEKEGLDPLAVDPLAVDLAGGELDAGRFDPSEKLADLAGLLGELSDEDRHRLDSGDVSALPGLSEFIDRFGHLSASGNDFSVPRWRDDPNIVVEILEGMDRSRPASSSTESPALGARLERLASRAGRWQLARDHVSDMYTRVYGGFRPLFLEVGRRLAERGVLSESGDVMFLTWDEAIAALLHPDASQERIGDVDDRRREMTFAADLVMPETIFGDDFSPEPAADATSTQLRGVAVSRGVITGRARVAATVSDATRVTRDDVLVVPYSDVAWTSVLRKAGGIVAESGGMLSHSSIIAREQSIPCVVSVGGALRISDGSLVTVDGTRGTVSVVESA